MNLRTTAFAAVALVAFGTGAVSFAQTAPGPQGTPPPPPVPQATSSALLSTSPEPSAAPSDAAPPAPSAAPSAAPGAAADASPSPGASAAASPEGRRGRRGRSGGEASPGPGPSPTDTPEPPQFSTLDGVWEVAFQPLTGARTTYTHLYVTQTGNDLKGTWRKDGKTVLPFTGTFDGRLIKITVASDKTTYTFSGYEENFMDMVGLFSDGDTTHQGTPFTAAHRKREHDREVNIR